MGIRDFVNRHYRHFNAATLRDAADEYINLIDNDGKMFISIAGAMSTAELGVSLAEMIRKDKIHAISCTGANLEEDVFNLIAHDDYYRLPDYRDLTPKDEQNLFDTKRNRVTDTCIPEDEAMRLLDNIMVEEWKQAEEQNIRKFPHEFLYDLINSKVLEKHYQIDPKDSWVAAAAEKNIPIFIGGWEDSTLGNSFAAEIILYPKRRKVKNPNTIKNGIEYMIELEKWYRTTSANHKIGFFQIGGGIAGDFPICVVPMMNLDLAPHGLPKVPVWSFFCQISDSTTSYGSYSGAVPNEKISWGKLAARTPKFIIESDATIVAPLIFEYVLDDSEDKEKPDESTIR